MLRSLPFVLFLSVVSCSTGHAPGPAPQQVRHYALSDQSTLALAQEPAISAELERVLIESFGEPADPLLRVLEDWASRNAAETDPLERDLSLREGGQLFVAYCARCHGFEGGGNGPLAGRLFPRPRNYRAGIFKFAGTLGNSKPRRQDLLRTLVQGLPGSAMPSFRNLSARKLNALVDYVCLLAVRGEVESWLVDEYVEDGIAPSEAVEELYELVWERWMQAEEQGLDVVAPRADASSASLQLGREVFLDPARGNCFSCHGTDGKGYGSSAWRVDDTGQRFAILKDEWGQFCVPRDFTLGTFRGGKRREDIFLRIYCGIAGTPMPSNGASLSTEEAWALVDYVLALGG